jgi:hypothetical protein
MTKAASLAGLISLFASSSTLVCCALPALMVALGAGASLAGLASNFPALVWLSENKELSFGFSILMLSIATQCRQVRAFSFRIYCLSVGLFFIGVFFAFVAPMLNQ